MSQHHARIILTDNPHEYNLALEDDIDVFRLDTELIGIDQIRTVITEAHRRPTEGCVSKNIILSALKITSEAQQAALKILEDTPTKVYITLLLPTGTHLLDTVLSRVQLESVQSDSSGKELNDWISLTYKERLSEVDAKVKAKDLVWMQQIKNDLQSYVKESSKLGLSELKEIQLVIENLLTRGASNKMLLEHLALSLPLTR